MKSAKNRHTYCVRNVESGQTVSLEGDGEYCIGLTLDERISCTRKQNSKDSGDSDIAVPLVMLTVWKTAGVTVSPASRDLRCCLNGENITSEVHIIPGDHIEVGDKVLELIDETVTKTPRRHLPPTPGIPILPTPPPKPQRNADSEKPSSSTGEGELQPKDGGHDALREWCQTELPNSEHELLQRTKDPEQLASLAANYLTRHIKVHTDVVMSADLTDRIFKILQEVAHHRKDILRKFLTDIISDVTDEDNCHQVDYHHAIVTAFLVEILRQFLDPGYLVLVCLQLLRALSHIPGNVATMITNQTTAAVLGSMAVYKDDESVQNNCLDILAKMATYMPVILEKPPMRESSIDLVAMAMTLHSKNLTVIQAGIRTLANLASSLHSLAFAAMTDSPYPDLKSFVNLVITVLEYLYNTTVPLVRNSLGVFCADLTVKMDGRRFLFEYAKMDQLKYQQKLWEQAPDGPPRVNHQADNQQLHSEDSGEYLNDDPNEDHDSDNNTVEIYFESNSSKFGILKKSRSFENLRTPERKVSFINEDNSPSSSASSSLSTSSPISEHQQVDHAESPDIQVLSRSRIYPAGITSDSTDSDIAPSQTSYGTIINTPSSPVKLPRRSVGAPVVHVNSQSDSDADALVDSPSDQDLSLVGGTKYQTSSNSNDDDKLHFNDLNSPEFNTNGQASSNHTSPLHHSSSGAITQSSSSPYQHYIPVDLSDFRYSAADIHFMKRLMSVQVTCHVCSAAIRGCDPPALKLIDMALHELLSQPGIPNAVWQFANSQFDEQATLMDIDPAAVISVIDVVRYKMLAFDLVRKSLQLLIQSLSSKLHPKMFQVAGEVIQSMVRDTALSPTVADEKFVATLEQDLQSVQRNMRDPKPITALINSLSFLLKSKSHQEQTALQQ